MNNKAAYFLLRISLTTSKHNTTQLCTSLVKSVRMASTTRTAANFHFDKAYVDGKWESAKSGKSFSVSNPASGEVIGQVPEMNQFDVSNAIDKAHTAFGKWKHSTPKERSIVLRKWFDLMIANKDALADLIVKENGKPRAEAVGEIMYSAGFLEWYAEEAKRVYGDLLPFHAPNKRAMVVKQPCGVAGMITPWNFPSAMITRKAGAAIAAGCTVVCKPSEDTPLSALAMCQLAEEAGLPAGVLNVVTCSRDNASAVGKELCENTLVSKISFTGSTAVGKILLSQCASTVKKTSMELGGNAPFIIFDSGDLNLAAEGAIASRFRCTGQTCVSANRILVQEGVYSEFVKILGQKIKEKLKVGDGMESGTTQGPLINARAVEKIDGMVKEALSSGANLVSGGQKHARGACFYEPTLLSNVTVDMRVAKEEIFGPVAAVIKFKTEQEAVAIANSVRMGLAGYFYTKDIPQAWRVSEALEFGMVGVNEGLTSAVESTFGGWKESGMGTEGGKYGIDEYLEKKTITYGGIQPQI